MENNEKELNINNDVSKLKTLYEQIVDKNPEESAKILYLADKYNTSPDFIKSNNIFNKDLKLELSNMPDSFWKDLELKYPKITEYLDDSYKMSAISNEWDKMFFLERWFKQAKSGFKLSKLQSDLSDKISEKIEMANKNMSLLPEKEKEIEDLKKQIEEITLNEPEGFAPIYHFSTQALNMAKPLGYGIAGATAGAITSLTAGSLLPLPEEVVTLPYLAGKGFIGGALFGTAKTSYEMEKNLAYDDYINNGISHDKAIKGAEIVGAINSALETAGDVLLYKFALQPLGKASTTAISKIPLAQKVFSNIQSKPEVFAKMSMRKAISKSVADILKLNLGEVSTEYAQEVTSGLTGEILKKQSDLEYNYNQIFNRSLGIVSPTLQATFIPAMLGAGSNIYVNYKDIKQAEITKNKYLELGNIAKDIKLKDINNKEFENIVKKVSEDSNINKVILDIDKAEKYFQSKGIDFKSVINELGEIEQYNNLKDSESYIEIPIEKWVSKVVGTEHYNNLVDNIKFSYDSFTNNELEEINKEAEKNIEFNIEEFEKENSGNKNKINLYDDIYNYIKNQLIDVKGGFNKISNKDLNIIDKQAKIFSMFAIKESERRGIDSSEFWQKMNLPKIVSVENEIADKILTKNITDLQLKYTPETIENINDSEYVYNKSYNQFVKYLNENFTDIDKNLNINKIYKETIKQAISKGFNIKNKDILKDSEIKDFSQKYNNTIYSLFTNESLESKKEDLIKYHSKKIGVNNFVNIVNKIEELPDNIKKDISDKKLNNIEAVTYDNKIYIVKDNIKLERIESVILHESIVHFGLRNAMDIDKFINLINEITEKSNIYVNEIIEKYGLDISTEDGKLICGEEILALLIEKSIYEPNILETIYPTLRKYLKEFGFYQNLDIDVIKNIISKSVSKIKNDKSLKQKSFDSHMAKYSVNSWDKTNKEELEKINNKYKFLNKEDFKNAIKDISYISEFISNKARYLLYEPFNYEVLKNNKDKQYPLSMDFSTSCVRRSEFISTLDEIIKQIYRKNNRIITSEEIMQIRELMKSKGYVTDCGICFVFSKRMGYLAVLEKLVKPIDIFEKDGKEKAISYTKKYAKENNKTENYIKETEEFINKYNKVKDKLNFKLSDILLSFNSTEKIDEKLLTEKDKDIIDLYNYAKYLIKNTGGVGSGKDLEGRTDYKGEILKLSEDYVKKLNKLSGLRWQSWSDFQIEHVIDMMQAILDMSIKGLVGHMYTKISNAVKLLGNTNMSINMSLIPLEKGLDEKGNLLINDYESFNLKEAIEFRKKYRNVGTIIIGNNDEQIFKALDTDWIDMVIPYHKSGMRKELLVKYGYDKWKDYELYQSEKDLPSGIKDFEELENKFINDILKENKIYLDDKIIDKNKFNKKDMYKYKSESGISFIDLLSKKYEQLKNSENKIFFNEHNGNIKEYFSLCKKRKLIPKFIGIINKENGQSIINHPNYYKLLADRRIYDNKGKYIEQEPVKPIFNIDVVIDMLSKNKPASKDIKYDVVKEFMDSKSIRYSIDKGFFDKKKNIIALFDKADVSTFLHESAHYWLNDIFQYVKSGQASSEYMNFWKDFKKYFNISDNQDSLTKEQQEKFAVSFEVYLMKNEVKNENIKEIFNNIKKMMIKSYKDNKDDIPELKQEIKDFFDRLIIPETIYNSVKSEYSLDKKITDDSGMLIMYKKYDEEVINDITSKLMEDITKDRKEFIKKEYDRYFEEKKKELENKNFSIAKKQIEESIKISIDDILKQYKENRLNNSYKEILSIISDFNQYKSYEEMLKDIEQNKDIDLIVKKEADEYIKKFDILNDNESIKEIVNESINKAGKISMLQKEISFIRSKIKDDEKNKISKELFYSDKKEFSNIVKNKARESIMNMPIEMAIKYRNFKSMAKKSRDMFIKYYTEKDYINALKYKKNEMYASALTMYSIEANKEYKRIIRFLNKETKKDFKVYKKEEHYFQVWKLLRRFGFVTEDYQFKNEISLKDWIEKYEELSNIIDIPEWLIDESKIYNIKNIKIQELKDLENSIKNIKQIANFENLAFTLFNRIDINELSEKLKKEQESNIGNIEKYKLTRKLSFWEKLKKIKNSIKFSLLNIESLLIELDGFKEQGLWWQSFYKPISESSDKELILINNTAKKLKEIYSVYTKKELESMDNDLIFIPEINESLTKNEIMVIALNMGNSDNLKRLIDGRNWDEETLNNIINKYLTKKDFDVIQNIWDLLDSFWADIEKTYLELTGFAPEKVSPKPLITKYGIYRGGYFPLVRDARIDIKAYENEQLDQMLKNEPSVFKATTKNNHTKKRLEYALYPVDLNINTIQRHLRQVIHDISFRKVIIDLNRLLSNDNVKESIKSAYGIEGLATFKEWIKTIATNNMSSPMRWYDKFFYSLRKRSLVAILGWRFSTMFQQFSTLPVIIKFDDNMSKNKGKLLSNCMKFYTDILFDFKKAKEKYDLISSKSVFMSTRMNNIDRDLNEMMSSNFGKEDKITKLSMIGITFFDTLISLPSWETAYTSAISDLNMSEEQAIDYADKVIRRTQGSGYLKDLPEIMRGNETKKLFTMFYSYMNAQLNNIYTQYGQFEKGKISNIDFIGKLIAIWILPVILSEYLALRTPDSEESKENEILNFWIKKIISYPISLIPIARDIGDMILDRSLGIKGGGYRITPISSTFENIGNAISTLSNEDKENLEKIEAVSKVSSYVIPYPDQFNILLFNMIDNLNGADFKPSDLTKRKKVNER